MLNEAVVKPGLQSLNRRNQLVDKRPDLRLWSAVYQLREFRLAIKVDRWLRGPVRRFCRIRVRWGLADHFLGIREKVLLDRVKRRYTCCCGSILQLLFSWRCCCNLAFSLPPKKENAATNPMAGLSGGSFFGGSLLLNVSVYSRILLQALPSALRSVSLLSEF